MILPFQPLKKRKIKLKKLFGFDIETYGKDNEFILASIYSDDYKRSYLSKKEFLDDLKINPIFKDCMIFATNLGFDFMGTFESEFENVRWCMRGSDLIFCRTYAYGGKFNLISRRSTERILFLDTMNFYRSSVEELGKIINIPKMKHPDFLGKMPKNKDEWDYLTGYNLRDSEITYKFIKKLYDNFAKVGINPKYTIASTSMAFFRTNYLKDIYWPPKEVYDTTAMFESYYGGRTEVYKRGTIKNVFCYDMNSLYPSVMINNFPDPNSMRFRKYGKISYIEFYEGQTYIEATCPKGILPLLPMKRDDKLIFATGHIKGSYTHIEIRKALSLGYIITKIGKQYFFKNTCRPFDDFVKDLYSFRKATKKTDFMNIVWKLILNSHYGKYGQKYLDKSGWHFNNFSADQLNHFKNVEIKGQYVRITEDRKPSSFCIPIWASYVTSYGRLKLYDYLVMLDPIACDTDSVFTQKEIPTSDDLGYMKLEGIGDALFVRPKFYMFMDKPRLKGAPCKINKDMFMKIIIGDQEGFRSVLMKNHISIFKPVKMSSALRRGLKFNENVENHKEFGLEDTKRAWDEKFDPFGMQLSKPLHILESGFTEDEIIIHNRAAMLLMRKQMISDLKNTDFFDSMGNDITKEEFMMDELTDLQED